MATSLGGSLTASEAVPTIDLEPLGHDPCMTRVILILLLTLVASSVQAQSLAELAKQEEARRRTVKEPAKVYTNRDLKPEPRGPSSATPAAKPEQAPPTPAPAPAGTPTVLPGGSVAEVPKSEPLAEEKGETHWRALITAARAALERSRVLADALQSRLNALATDIVNRDDPAQRSQLERDRQRALAELDRTKIEITEQVKAIAEIEEDARRAGVPPGWLR